ncbi:MAG: hypothetical protein EHM58_00330 [Ignavibacteriae bacterium]|nr:MAG: hypothetical protein EHM58_00330 [Ignavibacteriota bacterium]
MKKALVIYNSKTGKTKSFAENISNFLNENNIDAKAVSIIESKNDDVLNADYIFLGCWTSGLFLILQHPEKVWIEFANTLPDLKNKKVGLFTTYKLATGSMFRNMKKHLNGKIDDVLIEIKSRNNKLDTRNSEKILEFIK